jgi:hypothetical protein
MGISVDFVSLLYAVVIFVMMFAAVFIGVTIILAITQYIYKFVVYIFALFKHRKS